MKWYENNLSWLRSAIRFFLQKKNNSSWPIDAIAYNALGSWCFLQKMAQIKSEIVTGCTIKRLKMIYLGTSGKTRKKSEILESKYPIYAWSEGALVRRPQYFDIKFTNYEEERSCEMRNGPCIIPHLQSINHFPARVWTVKNTHRLSAWYDKNWSCITLRMLFVCLFWGSLVFMKQLFGIRGLTTLNFLWPRAWLLQSNADTQSTNHKKFNFYPYLRTMQLWSNRKCCLQFPNSFAEKEFFSALQPELTLAGWITM